MKKVTITNVDIINAREIGGVLIIVSHFTLNNGDIFEYESHEEIDQLDALNQLGGTQSSAAKEALGDDYRDTVCHYLVEAAKKKWDTLEDLLAEVRKPA